MHYKAAYLSTSVAVLATFLTVGAQAGGIDGAEPPAIYIDEGACPFECCSYQQWTVIADTTTLLDQPNGAQTIALLHKGDAVNAITGEVRSVPLEVLADRDIPETPIRSGDKYYVLHYSGEGYWKVWFDGKIVLVHQSIVDVPHPKSEWWVKVRDHEGHIGWALSRGNFGNQDACE